MRRWAPGDTVAAAGETFGKEGSSAGRPGPKVVHAPPLGVLGVISAAIWYECQLGAPGGLGGGGEPRTLAECGLEGTC